MMQERFSSGRHNSSPRGDWGVVIPAARNAAPLREDVEHPRVIWSEAFKQSMVSLGDKVTDYLAVLHESEESASGLRAKPLPPRNKLTVYYEGRATIDEVALVFLDALPMLAATCHPLVISNLRDGTLRRCRQDGSREHGLGTTADLDEHWVQGLRYRVPLEAVIHSRLGWLHVADTRHIG